MTSFYSQDELERIGFKSIGRAVRVSREARIYSPDMISLGDHVRIDDFCLLSGGRGIDLGHHVHVSAYSGLYGAAGISIGNYAGVSPRVTILSESDDFSGESMVGAVIPREYRPGLVSRKVCVQDFVQVGAHSTLMPGVTLHEGVVIGAHSFVNRSCEAWSVYAGVPARRLKARSRKVLDLEAMFRQGLSCPD
jgi:galactoside O-acetyltransferase